MLPKIDPRPDGTSRGVVLYRTLHRHAAEELGFRRRLPTVPVVTVSLGTKLQIDYRR